jgi:hypothetical protein
MDQIGWDIRNFHTLLNGFLIILSNVVFINICKGDYTTPTQTSFYNFPHVNFFRQFFKKIFRASFFLKDPEIIILDEPTSARRGW